MDGLFLPINITAKQRAGPLEEILWAKQISNSIRVNWLKNIAWTTTGN